MIPWVSEFSLSSAAGQKGPSGLGIIWLLAGVTEAMEVLELVSVIQKVSRDSRSSGTLWAWTQTWWNITFTACTLIQAQLGGVVGAHCRGEELQPFLQVAYQVTKISVQVCFQEGKDGRIEWTVFLGALSENCFFSSKDISVVVRKFSCGSAPGQQKHYHSIKGLFKLSLFPSPNPTQLFILTFSTPGQVPGMSLSCMNAVTNYSHFSGADMIVGWLQSWGILFYALCICTYVQMWFSKNSLYFSSSDKMPAQCGNFGKYKKKDKIIKITLIQLLRDSITFQPLCVCVYACVCMCVGICVCVWCISVCVCVCVYVCVQKTETRGFANRMDRHPWHIPWCPACTCCLRHSLFPSPWCTLPQFRTFS